MIIKQISLIYPLENKYLVSMLNYNVFFSGQNFEFRYLSSERV